MQGFYATKNKDNFPAVTSRSLQNRLFLQLICVHLDANRHLANSAYINFMGHTRMSFLLELGLDHKQLVSYGLGPVVFYEHFIISGRYYPAHQSGMAEDGRFFEFHHDLYDAKGTHMHIAR